MNGTLKVFELKLAVLQGNRVLHQARTPGILVVAPESIPRSQLEESWSRAVIQTSVGLLPNWDNAKALFLKENPLLQVGEMSGAIVAQLA